MSKFNIHGSKIEQLSESGNNYKLTTSSGSNAVSEQGNVVHSEGSQNKVIVDRPKISFGAMLLAKLKTFWGWMRGPAAG